MIYTCPMHPNIRSETPGICSECGMNLLPAREEEYKKHAGHTTEMFLKKFWVSLVLTVPVVLYNFVFKEFPVFFPLIFGSIVFFYGGWIFLEGAARELKARLPGMMTLIGLAISTAYFYSVGAVILGQRETLFWELTTLITVMLLGHYMEMRAVSSAQGALKELSKLLPDTAEIERDGKLETIQLAELKEGDIVFIRPGARIPADGRVIEGKSHVNEAAITGESKPVEKDISKEVIAGTINGDGSLKVKVIKVGEKTFLAGVMRLVKEAQASKSRLQILSDRAAFYLTIIAIGGGALTFVLWILAQAGFGFALERLVAVLVIACPHALGLAVPLVASISTTLAARQGFLVKQRLALELARKVNLVIFDKTGTLTKGEFGITKIWSLKVQDEKEVLRLAASIGFHSEHYISRAIVKKAKEVGVVTSEVKDFVRIPGKGVKGILNGREVMVGGYVILIDSGVSVPPEIKKEVDAESGKGETIIYVIQEKELAGVLALADLIRDESKEAIKDLKKMGVKVSMITGDSEDVASWVAKELVIEEYFSKVLPHEKSEKIRALQAKGVKVAMVGDGINDAPALVQADLGIAIGAGTNVAIESAGIILAKNDPRDIVKIIKLSHLTYAKMMQNLFWATGYNVVALPLAAGAMYSKGIILEPALAALFMSLSTVIVAVNALLLKKKVL